MTNKPTGKPMGRPPKHIDWKEFEKRCAEHCTQQEICDALGVHDETLRIRIAKEYGLTFPEAYKKFSAPGKMSLRRLQFKHAEKNAAMAIFLGKVYLGQREADKVGDAPPNDENLALIHDLLRQNKELRAKLKHKDADGPEQQAATVD